MSGEGGGQASRAAAYLILLGYRQTQCLSAATGLGVFDRLQSGPEAASDLALHCNADAHSMQRLLRTLVAMQVLSQDGDGRFHLTSIGSFFTSEQLGPVVRYMTIEPSWRSWARLGDSVRTGQRAFDLEHDMRDWDYYAANPNSAAIFDAAMRSLTAPSAASIIASHDFSTYRTVADIGGGDGSLLIAILSANPGLEGILFDRPHVLDRAAGRLAEAGVSRRCRTVGGSFLEEVPAGADAYVLKWILHDWEDRDAQRILNVCRRAMSTGGDLILIERVLPDRITPQDLEAVLADLQMMVMNGGVERNESEFRELLAGSGFRLESVTPTTTPVSVIRAIPV